MLASSGCGVAAFVAVFTASGIWCGSISDAPPPEPPLAQGCVRTAGCTYASCIHPHAHDVRNDMKTALVIWCPQAVQQMPPQADQQMLASHQTSSTNCEVLGHSSAGRMSLVRIFLKCHLRRCSFCPRLSPGLMVYMFMSVSCLPVCDSHRSTIQSEWEVEL